MQKALAPVDQVIVMNAGSITFSKLGRSRLRVTVAGLGEKDQIDMPLKDALRLIEGILFTMRCPADGPPKRLRGK